MESEVSALVEAGKDPAKVVQVRIPGMDEGSHLIWFIIENSEWISFHLLGYVILGGWSG